MERTSSPPPESTAAASEAAVADLELEPKQLEAGPEPSRFRTLLAGKLATDKYLADLRAEAARITTQLKPPLSD